MPTPAATILNTTATGDAVTGPGCPLNLVNGLPVACMGDTVAGPVCTGAITVSTAVTRLVKGRPMANIVNPVTGVPVATALAVCPNINRIV